MQSWEFEAEHPCNLECFVETPLRLDAFSTELVAPILIGPSAVRNVRLGFHASSDPRHKMWMRTDAARSPQAVLDEVRAKARQWEAMAPDAGPSARMRNHLGAELLE